jgi:hypothetical protein
VVGALLVERERALLVERLLERPALQRRVRAAVHEPHARSPASRDHRRW